MATGKELCDVAASLLEAAGLELWDVEVSGDALRFLVDRPGGVDMDALAAASHTLSPMLDAREDLVPAGRYQLEVSSPGIERTLRRPDQYQQYVGTPISVKTAVARDGARRFEGTLAEVGDETFSLVADGQPASTYTFRYDQVERARTVMVWGAPPSRARTPVDHPGQPNRKDAAS